MKNRKLYSKTAQALIVAGIIAAIGFSFAVNVLGAQKHAGVPEKLLEMKVGNYVDGSQALKQVNQLHGTGINLTEAIIAEYSHDFNPYHKNDEKLSDQAQELLGKRKQLTQSEKEKIQEGWTPSSLKHDILILESRILHHSLGDPDMPPHRLRTYHIKLFMYDYNRYEEDYGPNYEARLSVFMDIRKGVLGMTDDEIALNNSVSPELDMWWEDLWGTKPRRRFAQNKEVAK